ncbi:unnamed protein product [Adineta ricciae]|uniref:OTU domain-containing protein n=1 Tax=Adineta ricciae TaxID=249248 RepID=A0A814I160_ADIRI|nr:unnamed protein product [Adineta ricciae]CAF1016785.1 unnamed protein product [Adineta ricciae]
MKSYSPFCLCSRRNQIQQSTSDFQAHEQQLNFNLSDHNIQRLQVDGDGNCLFYALAEGLLREMKKDPYNFGSYLQSFGVSIQSSLVSFAKTLRQICVTQWKLNEHYYSQFVDMQHISFAKEMKKFSKTGVSDSILGDIVPLTISNIFNVRITIFTSLSNMPRIDIKPENSTSSLACRRVIYLAYNQYGAGHYDAAYPRL